jgi:carboxymethylenebutenolidase
MHSIPNPAAAWLTEEPGEHTMQGDMLAETLSVVGYQGKGVAAYLARPLDPTPVPGVIVVHHGPGWDEGTKEITRKIASRGYVALAPHLYHHFGPHASPDDAAAAARAVGGISDEMFLGDIEGSVRFLRLQDPKAKVGIIGFCSGGRQAFLAACKLSLDAAVDCYGACVMYPPQRELPFQLSPVIGFAEDLSCPLLGLFGADDTMPSPDEVAQTEVLLRNLGKSCEFHTYQRTGHAFFDTDRDAYRPEAATDGWRRIFDWFSQYLGDQEG